MRDYQEHNAKDIRDLTIYTKTIPAHPAAFADFPAAIHPDIRTYLTSHNIPRLYTHQAEMFDKAQSGENVVITTSTASGKTLSFLLPVLQAVLENPLTRAIFVYPTKALAADQYRALQPVLEYFGAGRISAGVYDVRGKVILQSQGKEFFTWHGKEFFTWHGKEFFTSPGNHFFTSPAASFITGGVSGSSSLVYCKQYTREETFMLTKTKMQEIQDLKLQGYTKADIIRYYEAQGRKPPSRPTLSKYYDMDVIPDDPGAKLAKPKTFDVEPFRSTIVRILETNSGKSFCMSSVYDVLEEKFIENGDYEKLPGNQQTLRNYIHYLEDSGQINREPEHRRIYDYVFDTPPGEQMLIDFGEQTLSKTKSIHFICLLLRYSRFLCVYAQDHKYNSEEACKAIYHSFCRLGGRPKELVIDQDAVFVASETYGEVIKTRTFEDFCTEQDLRLWVCNKADPESKGPIENSVGFVKKNFFSARKVTCIDDVWRSLPGWLERKNQRIHRSTLRVPKAVYDSVEKSAMRPLLPSVYETSPNTFRTYEIAALPYVLYKSCRYSVPRDYAFKTVRFKVVSGKIHIYDDQLNYICSHNLSERKGSVNQLPEHRKQDSGDWIEIMERLRGKWNCYDFQHFINGVKKENPRHISKQLRAIEQFLDSENPDKSLVAQVMKECCQKYRYQFSQFKVVYSLAKAGRELATDDCRAQVPSGSVSYTDLSVYAKAFQERTERKEAAAR